MKTCSPIALLGEELSQQLSDLLTTATAKRSFVVGFSGIDGSGKSTQVVGLDNLCQQLGLQTFYGKTIFHGLKSIFRLSEKMFGDPYAYHPTIPSTLREFVIACDVAKYYLDHIEPQLNTNKIILLDRCSLCYRVYAQAYEADQSWIRPMHELIHEPDIIILLDTPVDTSQHRLQQRVEKPLQSDEKSKFLHAVRNRYLAFAKTGKNVYTIDATCSQEEVLIQICQVLVEHLM